MSHARLSGMARILVLSKRQYMGRDLLDDSYGRFWELPASLKRLGHEVVGLTLSYRRRAEGLTGRGVVDWSSVNARRLLPFGDGSYWRVLDRIGARFKPDLIWACSDLPHALIGHVAARRLQARLVVDLYDNFESYPLARIPGANYLLRRAVRAADGVSCVSEPLAHLVCSGYGFDGPMAVIENAIPPGIFEPRDRQACRSALGLPAGALLIGTAGALSIGRGTQYLLQAFQQLATKRADVHLVMAGVHDGSFEIPKGHPRIHYLGLLATTTVPEMISALDIAVVCNRDSPFGRYCFPQKLYEALACGVPVAVARVGAMAALLKDYPDNLYEPDDASSLFATLNRLCDAPSFPALAVPTWPMLARRLSDLLQRAYTAE